MNDKPENPIVVIQFGVNNAPIGTMEIELFVNIVPKTVKNFMGLVITQSLVFS